VNSTLFVYTRAGTQIGTPTAINTLVHTPAGWAVKYPHVVYDPASGRFILAVLQYNTLRSACSNAGSQIQVVVSGADPTATWQAPRTFNNLAVLPDVNSGDLPVAANLALGMTNTVVTIAWDYFGCLAGTFYGSQTDVIQRADLAAGTLGVNSAVAFTGGPLGVQPAMALSAASVEYQIANGVNCAGPAVNTYAVFAITGTPDLRNVGLTCAASESEPNGSSTPPLAPQGGTGAGTLQTNDDRFLSAVWSNNVLWAAGNTGCTLSGATRSCVNVVSVSAGTTGIVGAGTQLAPEGVVGAYLFYPALAVDSSGNVIATFDESSSGTSESIMVASITGGSTWSSPATLDTSSNFYSPGGCSPCTWGDYSGAVQDAAHPTDVWVVSEDTDGNISGNCPNANTCWNTFIGRYTFAAPSIASLSPFSGPAGGGQVVTVGGSDFATGTGVTITTISAGITVSNLTPDSFTFTTPVGPSAGGIVHVVATDTLGSSSLTSPGSAYLYVPLSNYVPITPFRLFDTRGGTPFGPATTHAVQVTGAGLPAIPTSAVAVVLNVTEVNGTAPSLLTVFPAGTPRPNASNLNFQAGTVTPNLVTVTLGGGMVDIFNAVGTVNVLADVEGYFQPPVASTPAGEFHSVAPVRICDTRSTTSGTNPCKTHGVLVGGAPMLVTVTGSAIPGNGTAVAAVLNLTGVLGTLGTYVSVYPTSSSGTCTAPRISTLNLPANAVEANRVMVELGPGPSGPRTAVCVFSAVGKINVVLDVNGWFGTATAGSGYQYQAIAPSRICDTRTTLEGCTSGAIGAGTSLARLIHVTGRGGVPGSVPVVQAVIANLTAVTPSQGTFLVAYPANLTTTPGASDLNLSAGAVLPNLVVVQLDTTAGLNDGCVYLFNAVGSVNAIIDIEGWFQ
jgi:IPT/TIG domain